MLIITPLPPILFPTLKLMLLALKRYLTSDLRRRNRKYNSVLALQRLSSVSNVSSSRISGLGVWEWEMELYIGAYYMHVQTYLMAPTAERDFRALLTVWNWREIRNPGWEREGGERERERERGGGRGGSHFLPYDQPFSLLGAGGWLW